jgi:hypothetical protein
MDVGVGRGHPVVAGTLVELERRKPMGGAESGCEVVGDDSDIGDAEGDCVTRSAGIGIASRSALEIGVFI